MIVLDTHVSSELMRAAPEPAVRRRAEDPGPAGRRLRHPDRGDRDFAVATRNVADFQGFGRDLVNPWSAGA
jgi:predicted nucleic acid-binding protein